MHTELANYREHADRYRATTLQVLDVLPDDAALAWRPTAPGHDDAFTLGQHLLHVAQTEDYYTRGLFEGAWRRDLLSLGRDATAWAAERGALRAYLDAVRARTRRHLDALPDSALDAVRHDVPDAPVPCTLRWWLWFVLEHELLHKGQVAVYLRLMGLVPPFYALPLPLGERPDVRVRAVLDAPPPHAQPA